MPLRVAILLIFIALDIFAQQDRTLQFHMRLGLQLKGGQGLIGELVKVGSDGPLIRLRDGSSVRVPWDALCAPSAYKLKRLMLCIRGAEASRHVQLARFCQRHALYRDARMQLLCARGLDPGIKGPDIDELMRKEGEAFLPGAGGLGPDRLAQVLKERLKGLEEGRKEAYRKRLARLFSEKKVAQIKTLFRGGAPSSCLDILLISDGFSRKGRKAFEGACQAIMRAIKNSPPFSTNPGVLNFYQITIAEPKDGLEGDTALGCKVSRPIGCKGILILTCDWSKVQEYSSLVPADLTIVIANTGRARSTAYPGVITLDLSGKLHRTTLHELGHAFGGLDDEYVEHLDKKIPQMHRDWDASQEHLHINITREKDPKRVKWHYWNLPPKAGVGCYEGAYYRAKGYYRPQRTCLMGRYGEKFCVVCREQMQRRFYKFIKPIQDTSPAEGLLTICSDERITFEVTTLIPANVNWYLDGVPASPSLSGQGLDPGVHTMALSLDLRDPYIRRDNGVLYGYRFWEVVALPYPRPRLRFPPKPRVIKPGEVLVLQGKIKGGQEGLRAVPMRLPPGTTWDEKALLLRWRPPKGLRGAFKASIALLDTTYNLVVWVSELELIVSSPGANNAPLLFVPPVVEVDPTKVFVYRPKVYDPDGDGMIVRISGLPPGAIFDPFSDELFWDPEGFAGKCHTLKISVTDGQTQVSSDLKFILKDTSQLYTLVYPLSPRAHPIYRLLKYMRLLRVPGKAKRAISGINQLFDTRDQVHALNLLFMHEIKKHIWHFTDSPDVLRLISSRIDALKGSKQLNRRLREKVKEVRRLLLKVQRYNHARGIRD